MQDNGKQEMRTDRKMSRRGFLKLLGLAGVTAAGLPSCSGGKDAAGAPGEVPVGKMTYRVSPTTGDKVSLLGFGMMRLPTVGESGEPGGEEKIDQEMVNRLVDYALEHGVNYFDTSPAYCKGESERATGIALSRHPRDSYFIATKLSNFAPESQTRSNSTAMYRKSLSELQTDHIDYMLLHAIGMGDDAMETFRQRYINNGILDFLLEERKAGRIRNLGFSYHGDVRVFDYLLSKHDEYKWDFVQIQLNYVDWNHAKDINPRNTDAEYLYGELSRRGIPAVIMEPLLGGRLANVPDKVAAQFKEREPQRSVASWAFRFAGTFPGVHTVLSGMNRLEHLQDNIRSFAPLKPLDSGEMEFLRGVAEKIVSFNPIPCNDCKYCMPCPYGLDIPGTLLHYNKCLNDDNVPADSRSPEYARQRRAFLVGYDRSVPRLRQADRCIACGACAPHCPQGIDIPGEMQRISEYVEQLRRNPV